ncbi:MAG: DUF5911 domain-containing protein, partial [Planctomycetes bacterium]|nr:DUF5911 domain-containing protein [Planctomycetota bacterium]
MTRDIADYGLIGDGHTAALVGNDGSIEWLCLPRFDSPACFAAMLGDEENGRWLISPTKQVTGQTRRYRGDSLILETELTCETGTIRLTDFMPPREQAPDIVRIVECIDGEVEVVSQLSLRFDYGRIHPFMRKTSGPRILGLSGPNAVALDFEHPVEHDNRSFNSRFTLKEGEKSCFVLTWYPSNAELPDRVNPDHALRDTEEFWREWSGRIEYSGRYRDAVVRSLITLKAMVYSPTGGIVAAPTSSLPEEIGGERNWDYRFCWLRDSTFALIALIRMGLKDEAREWIGWLRRAVGGEPIDLRPFYTIKG